MCNAHSVMHAFYNVLQALCNITLYLIEFTVTKLFFQFTCVSDCPLDLLPVVDREEGIAKAYCVPEAMASEWDDSSSQTAS